MNMILSVIALVIGVIAILVSITAYSATRAASRRISQRIDDAIRNESRNLLSAFYMDVKRGEDGSVVGYPQGNFIDSVTVQNTVVLATTLMALWREGVIPPDRLVHLQALAKSHLTNIFPDLDLGE